MINSCGTGKPTEADGERGSGRKRRQLFGLFGCSGCSAVRLFGLFGCSAVRLFGLFGCSAGGGSPPPVRRIGERSEAPTEAGDSSSRIQLLSFSCAVVLVFVAVAFISCGEGSPPPYGQRRAGEAPTEAGDSSSNSRFQQLIFVLLFFVAVAYRRQRLKAIPPTTAKSPMWWLCWWCWWLCWWCWW